MVSSDDFMEFNIKNEDGTFNESININKGTVNKVKDFVDFLKEIYDDNLSDVALEIFVEFSFEYSLGYLNENRDLIVKRNR